MRAWYKTNNFEQVRYRKRPQSKGVYCLKQTVDKDNIVRIIEFFIISLYLKDLRFKTAFI